MIKISTRGRYGIMALLELAIHYGRGRVLLKDIAKAQNIPLAYLEQLVAPLKLGGVIRTVRGGRGGVLLTRAPTEIGLSEVFQLLEGSISPVECVGNPRICARSELCVIRDVWVEVKRAMSQVLDSITLQDLVERQKQKVKPIPTMYYI